MRSVAANRLWLKLLLSDEPNKRFIGEKGHVIHFLFQSRFMGFFVISDIFLKALVINYLWTIEAAHIKSWPPRPPWPPY